MTKSVKDQLWRLINSLDKAEKRNFKIYATRAGGSANSKFVLLFDLIAKQNAPDDAATLRKMKITNGQLSNLKRHLYQEVLTSLRLIHIAKEIDIELREQVDFVRILYGKGHYFDALRLLERAKTKAKEHNRDLLQLEIIEFEKLIEARHITLSRQLGNKMELLLNESSALSYSFLNTSELLNLNIQIHGRYIEVGHSRSPEEEANNEDFWRHIQHATLDRKNKTPTFHQEINRFQAEMWYAYIQLRLTDALDSALGAINRFQLSQQMIYKDPDLYLRCLYYVTVLSFLSGEKRELERYVNRLRDFLGNDNIKLNVNSRRIGDTYYYLARHNLDLQRDDYQAGYAHSHEVLAAYQAGDFRPNNHRWGLFLYKLAAACFLVREYDEALDYLNDVINMKTGTHREDLLINTRLLHALCNFELGNFSLVDYHLNSLTRLLRKSRETAELHRLAVSGLRRILNLPPAERSAVFPDLLVEVEAIADTPFEQKALTYLDLRIWLRRRLAT